MDFNLKKGWLNLFLASILSILASSLLFFFIRESFELKNLFNIDRILLSFYFFYQLKNQAIKKSISNLDEDFEFTNKKMITLFLEKTSYEIYTNKYKKPILNFDLIRLSINYFFIICYLLIITFFIHSAWGHGFLHILMVLFSSLVLGFCLLNYVFYRPLNVLYKLFIKPIVYYSKKKYNDGEILYLKSDGSALIFKNNVIHSENIPAYFENIEDTLRFSKLDWELYDNKPIEGFEKHIENNFSFIQRQNIKWFVYGKEIKDIENINDINEIKNKIKILKNAKNF